MRFVQGTYELLNRPAKMLICEVGVQVPRELLESHLFPVLAKLGSEESAIFQH